MLANLVLLKSHLLSIASSKNLINIWLTFVLESLPTFVAEKMSDHEQRQ